MPAGVVRGIRTCTVVLGLVALTACSSKPPAGDIAAGARRVVSLTPSLTSLVRALGAADELVGVTRHDPQDPHRPIAVVGDMRPNIEQIIAQQPSVVVVGQYGFNASDVESLRAAKLNVVALPLQTLADLRGAAQTLGKTLDRAAAATAIVTGLDDVVARAGRDRPSTRPRLLFVFDIVGGDIFTTGGGDHLAEVAAVVGADNVAAGGPVTRKITVEDVLRLDPELIIHTAPSARFANSAAALAWWRDAAPKTTATVNKRVIVWSDGSLAQLGAELPQAIGRLGSVVRAAAEP